MSGRSLRAALVAVTLLAVPAAPARACHLFDRLCGGCGTTTYYAPTVAAYAPAAPACCPQQQVVNYMPQTAYRSVVVSRPVVSYVPQPACDACGRSTTVMRPVTTYVAQQQLVPYTTYRPVVSTVAQPCCAPAPVAVARPCCGAAPAAVSYAPAPVAAPACCTPAVSAPAVSVPVTPTPRLAPPPGTPGAPVDSLSPTPDPSLNGGAGGSTFAPTSNATPLPDNGGSGNDGAPGPRSRVLMPPYEGSSSRLPAEPRGLDPEGDDRVTAIPVRPNLTVRQASLVTPAKSAAPAPRPANDGGWRPAGK